MAAIPYRQFTLTIYKYIYKIYTVIRSRLNRSQNKAGSIASKTGKSYKVYTKQQQYNEEDSSGTKPSGPL